MEQEGGSHEARRASRRGFLIRAAGAGIALLGAHGWARAGEEGDEEIVLRRFSWAAEQGLASKPIGDIMSAIGESFVGTPYLAHSLETPGAEHLVVNLRGLDCVTFVETSLAMARCVSGSTVTFKDYCAQLTRIRYADGIIDGYASRLHYFSDWIADNAHKGILREMTAAIGGEEYRKTINFMSAHRAQYPHLADDGAMHRIEEAETRLSGGALCRVPRGKIAPALESLRNGDIIGTVTSMEGMDISHTGMIIRKDGAARFLHAPLSGGVVTISNGSLADYVHRIASMTGIVVARPLPVAG